MSYARPLLAGVALAALACAGGDRPSGPAPLPVVVDATGTVPEASIGVPFTLTLRATGGTGRFSWSVTAGALPAGLDLSTDGVIAGTPTATGVARVTVQAASGTLRGTRELEFTVAHPPLVIVNTALPGAIHGRSYLQFLEATGGEAGAPLTWSLASGSLPAGLALASDGVIAGTPTAMGSFVFRLQARRGTRSAEQPLQLQVVPPPLVIVTAELPEARAGQPYVVQLQATGGIGTPTWRLAGGRLPAGMTLGADGTLAGTPTQADTTTLQVEATSGAQQVARTLSLVVEPAEYPARVVVTMPGDVFTPFIARIRPGGVVSWRFGDRPHNVIFAAAPGVPADIDIVSNVELSRTFPIPGAYRYDCTIHPGMAGRVEVR